MASYMAAVAVSIVAILGLLVALELTAPKSALTPDFSKTPVDELIAIAKDPQSENQVKAIHQLAKRPKSLDSIVPALAWLSVNSNARVRSAAENSLNRIGAPAAEKLKPFFAEKTLARTVCACSAVHAIGDPCKAYLPELKELINNGVQIERHAALFALKGIGGSGAQLIDDVIARLSDKDFNVRLMACRVLKAFGPAAAKAEPELLRLLDEGTPSVRGQAAIALAAIGPELETPNVVELIVKRLDGDGVLPVSPVEYERLFTALAMFGPKSEKHLGSIREGLTHRSVHVQVFAAFTILQITGKTNEPKKVLEKLLKNDMRAPQALDLVGQFGEEAAPFVPAIQGCLDSADPVTRETAIVALMRIGADDRKIIRQIERRLNDVEPDVQIAAKEALDSLMGVEY